MSPPFAKSKHEKFQEEMEYWGFNENIDISEEANEALNKAVEQYFIIVDELERLHPNWDTKLKKSLRGHKGRVAGLSVLINDHLREVGSKFCDYETLAAAAILHDLGKYEPDINEIISKNRLLTKKEKNKNIQHAQKGERLLRYVYSILQNRETENDREAIKMVLDMNMKEVGRAILHHHERQDGSGPFGRTKIGLNAEIIAVADAFDAMTNDRKYNHVKTTDEALDELLQCAGTQFNPEIVMALLKARPKNKEGVEEDYIIRK